MLSFSLSVPELIGCGVIFTGCAALYCRGRYEEWKQVKTELDKSKAPAKLTREKLMEMDKCVSDFGQIPVKNDTSIPETYWPTQEHPAHAHTVKAIVNANAKLIRDICFASKLSEDEYMEFLVPIFFNLARYIHVCPASDYHHHQGYGGLYTHSLEVAYYAANKAAGTIFDRNSTPQDKHNNRRRWTLTCILAGLLHDCGKPYTDMIITARDGRLWHKEVPLLTWLRNEGIEEYHVRFRPDREHNEHMAKALTLYRSIVPMKTFEFLGRTPTGQAMVKDLESALLYGKKGGLIGEILEEADGLSVKRDQLRQRVVHPAYKNLGSPQGDAIIKAIRALINNGSWTVNKDETSQIFNTRQGCFIQWSANLGEQISKQAANMGREGIPNDAEAIARILVEAGAAMTFTPEGSHKDSLYREIHPIFLQVGQLACIKLTDEKYVFDAAVPPSVIECLEEGVMPDEELKIAWRKRWGVEPSPIRSVDDERYAFDEDFVISQASSNENGEDISTLAEEEYFRDGDMPADAPEQEQAETATDAAGDKYGRESKREKYRTPYEPMQSEDQPVENDRGFGAKPKERPERRDDEPRREGFPKFVIDPSKPLSMQLNPTPIDNPNTRGRGRDRGGDRAERRDGRRDDRPQRGDADQTPKVKPRDLLPQNQHQRKLTKPLETARANSAAELLDAPTSLAASAAPDPENTPGRMNDGRPNGSSVASTGPGAVKPVTGSALAGLMPGGNKANKPQQANREVLAGLMPGGAKKPQGSQPKQQIKPNPKPEQKPVQAKAPSKPAAKVALNSLMPGAKPLAIADHPEGGIGKANTDQLYPPSLAEPQERDSFFLKQPTKPLPPPDPLLVSNMGFETELDREFPALDMDELVRGDDDAPNFLTRRRAASSKPKSPEQTESKGEAKTQGTAEQEQKNDVGAEGTANPQKETSAVQPERPTPKKEPQRQSARQAQEDDDLGLGLGVTASDLEVDPPEVKEPAFAKAREPEQKASKIPGLPDEYLPADYRGPKRPSKRIVAAVIAEQKLMRQIASECGDWIPVGIQFDARRNARWVDAGEVARHLTEQGTDISAIVVASSWHGQPRLSHDSKEGRLYIEE